METGQFKLQAPWPEVKERIKEHNLELTDEDLVYEPGKEDELLERLQRKMHINKEKIQMLIESLSYNTDKAS